MQIYYKHIVLAQLFTVPKDISAAIQGSALSFSCILLHSFILGIGFHFYAKNMQLYVHLTHKNVAFDILKTCLNDVKNWLSANEF